MTCLALWIRESSRTPCQSFYYWYQSSLIDRRMTMVNSLHRPWHLPLLKLALFARWEKFSSATYVTTLKYCSCPLFPHNAHTMQDWMCMSLLCVCSGIWRRCTGKCQSNCRGGSKGQLRQEGELCVVLNSLIMHKYRTKMQPGSDGTYWGS